MKKISMLIMAAAILVATTAFSEAYAQEKAMTNAEFAGLLVKVLGTPVPAGSENLPADEYYQVIANSLATVGITNFVNAAKDATITCAQFAEIVYPLVGGVEPLSIEEKLSFLIATISMPAYNLNKVLTLSEAAAILNNPNIVPLIAEAYRGPAFGSESGLAPGFTLEDTPSQS